MSDFKSYIINEYKKNVKDLSDYPTDDGLSPKQLKEFFDGRTDKEVKDSINGIIGTILAPSAAGQIGAEGGTVQEMLDSKVAKEEGKTLSTEDFTTEHKAKLEGIDLGIKVDVKNPKIEGVIELDDGIVTIGLTENGQLVIEKGASGITPACNIEISSGIYVNGDEVRTEGNTKDLLKSGEIISDRERESALENLGITKGIETESLKVGGAEISVEKDDEGCVVIHRPTSQGYVPDSTLKMGYDFLTFNGNTVYHSGNLKDLCGYDTKLDEIEKAGFMRSTGLDTVLGDVESALDAIIALQESYIGGDTE